MGAGAAAPAHARAAFVALLMQFLTAAAA